MTPIRRRARRRKRREAALNGEVLPADPRRDGAFTSDGKFAPGNKLAVGNVGGSVRYTNTKFLTQTLISKLNELDKNTGKARYYKLVSQLIKNALDRDVAIEYVDKRGRKKTRKQFIPGDQKALEYIFDRLEGKPIQSVGLGPSGGSSSGKLTVIFEPIDEEL